MQLENVGTHPNATRPFCAVGATWRMVEPTTVRTDARNTSATFRARNLSQVFPMRRVACNRTLRSRLNRLPQEYRCQYCAHAVWDRRLLVGAVSVIAWAEQTEQSCCDNGTYGRSMTRRSTAGADTYHVIIIDTQQ